MKRITEGLTATKRDILKPGCRLIKTSKTLIFPSSLPQINAILMIVLPVTLCLKRETLPLGIGKIHLSISIGIKVLMKRFKVLFTPVPEILHNLNSAKADNTYYQKVDYYLKPDLLILDELGFKRLPGYSADDFFEIISKRYEKGSVAHYFDIAKINGPSFRAKHLKKGGSRL